MIPSVAPPSFAARGGARALIVLAILLVAAPALADTVVLSFRGPNGGKVQTAVTSALAAEGKTARAGDTSFDDAAVMIGCDPAADACADQVLATLAVEEIVFGTATKSGDVVLWRAAAGKPRKTAKVRLEPGQALEASLAPAVRELYGDEAAPTKTSPPVEEPTAAPTTPAPEVTATSTAPPPPATSSLSVDAGPSSARRWAMISWGSAGAAAAVGLVFWLRASALQDDIDSAPDATPQDLARLYDLEDRAETSATLGNVLVVVSAGLAGVGTYYWIKHRRAERSRSAALAPLLVESGAGLVLTVSAP